MLNALRDALNDLVAAHRNDPLDLLTERDLQAFLFMTLRDSIARRTRGTPPGVLPPNTCRYEQVTTSLVHTEFGPKKVDIAIIDPGHVESTADYHARLKIPARARHNEAIWDLRVLAAVELKQLRIGYPLGGALTGLTGDATKLRTDFGNHPAFAGVAILFIQSCAAEIEQELHDNIAARTLDDYEVQEIAKVQEIADRIQGHIVTPRRLRKVVV